MNTTEDALKTVTTSRVVGKRAAAERRPLLMRVGDGPWLAPSNQWWENKGVFNPGAVQMPDGDIHLLYRAQGRDGVSRLGYVKTRDGVTVDFRSPTPVFEPDIHDEFERLGTEDPRIVRFGSLAYVTYTAASLYRATDPHPELLPKQGPPWRVRIALVVTEDFQTFLRMGAILPDMDDKDGVLFPEKIDGQYVLLHRLPPDIWLATSSDLRHWENHRVVLRTRPALWDETKVGAGPPPVRVDGGWLCLYHGFDHHRAYRGGFALLDARDPSKVLARSEDPALEPKAPWEQKGQVDRVVFPSGMIRRGDELLVYYGAADTNVGLVRGSVREILASLR